MVWRAGSPSCMRARSSTSSLMRSKGAVSETSGDGGTPRAYTAAKDSVCQLGDRTISESAYPHEAPLDQATRRPCDSNSPGLKHLERGDRGVG